MTSADYFRRLAHHIQPGVWARTTPDPVRRYPSEGYRYGVLLEVWPFKLNEYIYSREADETELPRDYPFLRFQDIELVEVELIHIGTLEFEIAGLWLSAFDLLALEDTK
jgi:hypothetical protein